MKSIYLAGPEVFLSDAKQIGEAKKAMCADYGFIGHYPMDGLDTAAVRPEELSKAIYINCTRLLSIGDFVIANLTPFRGVSADIGTAVEIGMARSLNKFVLGYTNNPDDLLVRMIRQGMVPPPNGQSTYPLDAAGRTVENFGHCDNLMVHWALSLPVIRHNAATSMLYHDLDAFKLCLMELKAYAQPT